MFTVVQFPEAINYSKSLPDIKINGNNSISLWMNFTKSGNIIQERYDPAGLGTQIVIKIADLIDGLIKPAVLPSYSNVVTVDTGSYDRIEIKLNDGESSPFSEFIEVIKGFAHRTPFDITGFLRDNWLNLMPKNSFVYYHQPLFLTAYPSVNSSVHINAKLLDGTIFTFKHADIVASKIQHININPGMIKGLVGGEYEYLEVFTKNSSNEIVIAPHRFYYRNFYNYNSDVFLYLNRLGGFDTLVMDGQYYENWNTTPELAQIDNIQTDFHTKIEFSVEKNSGLIQSELQRRQHVDFLNSTTRYYLYQGHFMPINLKPTNIETTRGVLNSYSFSFSPQNTKEIYPELKTSPYHINI